MSEPLREWLGGRVEHAADRERALREDGRGDEGRAYVEQVKLEALSEVLRATDDLWAV